MLYLVSLCPPKFSSFCCGRTKASPQTSLDVGGQWHLLKSYSRLEGKCRHIPGIPLFFQLE